MGVKKRYAVVCFSGVGLKEHSKSLLCRPSSLLACRGFKAARASGPGGSTCRSWCCTAADSAARNNFRSSASKRYCCSPPQLPIDVGTSILESPGLHAQVASYKMMNCLSEKNFFQSKVLLISPTHKRTEGRAPVRGSKFTSKDAALQGGRRNCC